MAVFREMNLIDIEQQTLFSVVVQMLKRRLTFEELVCRLKFKTLIYHAGSPTDKY